MIAQSSGPNFQSSSSPFRSNSTPPPMLKHGYDLSDAQIEGNHAGLRFNANPATTFDSIGVPYVVDEEPKPSLARRGTKRISIAGKRLGSRVRRLSSAKRRTSARTDKEVGSATQPVNAGSSRFSFDEEVALNSAATSNIAAREDCDEGRPSVGLRLIRKIATLAGLARKKMAKDDGFQRLPSFEE
ncbi:hypothetical protein BJ508DRAFT_304279 [Ascobolus immersus RN42]|uniref:Uncharacterized protein n=1 Tax=Ascobolus immersus RN42 TaxID=1160509 RepID=A0A3N4ICB3_ASCIM|nr:hypothetical protein BJ508DRAFT_304279 [Ascobolus immersus RN42]